MSTARARILFDAFYHALPGHRIGKHIATGGYAVNFGRYSPGDCYHPNGLAHLHAALSPRFDLRLLTQPYSDLSLYEADILLVTNPDYPLYEGAAPYRWTPEAVDALVAFVRRGGSVLLGVNSFLSRPDFWEENFDLERVSLLFDRIGVRWDPNFMSDDKNLEAARALGRYRIGYGQGGRVFGGSLPPGVEPILVRDENVYGFRARIESGTIAVLGDTGMISNGLTCFPGYENLAFLKELFDSLRPGWVERGVSCWDYVGSGSVSSAPSVRGLDETILRGLRPEADWVVDHHYRHLVWDRPGKEAVGSEVWELAPVLPKPSSGVTTLPARLHWLSLDSDQPGSEATFDLSVEAAETGDGTDLHLIGRQVCERITWSDVCARPEVMQAAGEIEKVWGVFEMRAALDRDGRPMRARWSQGQTLYARSTRSAHYGYEIVLSSASGAIVPRAAV